MSERRLKITVAAEGKSSMARSFPAGVVLQLGRARDCHLQLNAPNLSRHHAEVTLLPEGVRIRVLSPRGVRVGEEILQTTHVYPEASVRAQFGPYQLIFEPQAVEMVSLSIRRQIHRALLERIELERALTKVDHRLKEVVTCELRRLVDEERFLVPRAARAALVAELRDEVLFYGPLTALLADESVSEIMVLDAKTIYVERRGCLELTSSSFTDDEAVRACIERMISPLGRRLDEACPMVDARLPDGSRVNAVIPPLSLRGPCLTIRKFQNERLSWQDLLEGASLTPAMADLLAQAVRLKKNIVVSGGTGSGKTTLLNLLSTKIGESERIVTIEDAAELRLRQPHVVSLESKPPNLEGQGAVPIRALVKNALRMRPDRIIVGECRGGEALDMLQAMNTGHEGSMTTTHANSPAGAIERLETLCLFSGADLPLGAIRRQIASSVHLIVQQARLGDGRRLVTEIAEVLGVSEESNDQAKVQLRSLFVAKKMAGSLLQVPTGYAPSFVEEMAEVRT